MRKILLLCLCAAPIIFSCKKSSSAGGTTNASQYYVSSVKVYTPGMEGIDSFTYSSDHLLTSYTQYDFDSTSGSPQTDSVTIGFAYFANTQVPSSYVYSHILNGTFDEVHQLTYDGQNRVIRDTCPSGFSFIVTHFSYPGNNVAANVEYSTIPFDNLIDTMFISDGNVGTAAIYTPNDAGTADTLGGKTNYSYSSYANPVYHSGISGTIGELLFILSINGIENSVDFNSRDELTAVTQIWPFLYSFSYNLGLDSKGRVAELTSPLQPSTSYRITYSYY